MYKAIILSIIAHLILFFSISESKEKNNLAIDKSIKSNLIFYKIKPEKKLDKPLKKPIDKKLDKQHLAENLKIDTESNIVEKRNEIVNVNKSLIVEKELKVEKVLKVEKSPVVNIKENLVSNKDTFVKTPIIEEVKVEEKNEVGEKSKVEVKEEEYEVKKEKNIDFFAKDKNFSLDSDGSYIAINPQSTGINLTIKSSHEPKYPSNYRRVRLRRGVVIETSFIINTEGKVEDIKVLNNNPKEFEEEVIKALKLWSFEPVVYMGEKIKIKANKNFIFK